jgi:protein kinase X
MAARVNSYAYAPNKVETKPKRKLTRGGSFAALRGAVTSRLRWLSFDRKNSSRKRSLSSEWYVDGESASMRAHREDLPKINVKSKGDVVFLKEIGGGMLGAVFLAKSLNTRTTCCVKVMQKWKVMHLEQENNVSRELELMKRFDSPFLTRAMGAFQDDRALYLVMEYFCGGDLFQLLVNGPYKGGKFPVHVAEFYAAEVLMALQYIHEREYVYRDLKPENVLIDSRGHVKLTDLGFCRRLLRGERAYTTCGTADYMAPEVMLAQGYDQAADYWSFGVLVYEMLVGYAPFASVSDGDRHRRIVTSDLKFHAEYFPLTAKSLIARLCVVDVAQRLGSSARGIEDLKNHAFFTVDWSDVAARLIAPPYVPARHKVEDTPANTDSTVARHQSRELLKQLDRRGERERRETGAGFPTSRMDAFAGF